MKIDVLYESLRFADRDTLDAAMLAGQMLHKMLAKPRPFDVLRDLGNVELNEYFGAFDISFLFNNTDGKVAYCARQIDTVQVPTFLARFNRGFVPKLSACCGCSKFLRILARHTSDTVFTIKSLRSVGAEECRSKFEDPGEDFVREVVEALHLKMFSLRCNGYVGKLPIVEHAWVRTSIESLCLRVGTEGPPARLMPYLTSSSLQLCAIATHTLPDEVPTMLAWMDELIRTFRGSPDPSTTTPVVTVLNHVFAEHANMELPRSFKNAAKSKIFKESAKRLEDALLEPYFGHKSEKTDGELYSFRAFPHRLDAYVWRAFEGDTDCIVCHLSVFCDFYTK